MSHITVLPHALCPQGAQIEADPGQSLCDALLGAGIEIEHACEKVAACATCHVWVKQGLESLRPPGIDEEDQLDAAWGLTAQSRLACCVKVGEAPLTIEIPRHSRNHAREHD